MNEIRETNADVLDAKIAVQESSLSRTLQWVQAVDTKSSIISGIALAMLAVLGTAVPTAVDCTWCTGLALAVGGLPLLACVWFSTKATRPMTDGPVDSLIYFGAVAKLSAKAFREKTLEQSSSQRLDDLLAQCHRNAQIAEVKYAAVRRATTCLRYGTVAWVAALVFLHMESQWV